MFEGYNLLEPIYTINAFKLNMIISTTRNLLLGLHKEYVKILYSFLHINNYKIFLVSNHLYIMKNLVRSFFISFSSILSNTLGVAGAFLFLASQLLNLPIH